MQPSRPFTLPGLMAATTLITALIVVGFATVAMQRVGHWPFYSHPDPKDLKLPYLHIAALFSYPLGLLSFLIGLMSLLGSRATWSRANAVVFVAATVLWCGATPGRLLEWLLD